MERYKNLRRNSGVFAFQILPDTIIVEFKDGKRYEYNSSKPGQRHTKEMQRLALTGRGLGTYINQYVRDNYARKLR
jgi:hypothetical protein